MSTPAVALHDLDKSFGDVHAVAGIDLTIEPGEIVALLGPNGAGKSTTNELLTIALQVFLTEGTVRNHLSAAMGKLGAGSRAEAVRLATENGWLG